MSFLTLTFFNPFDGEFLSTQRVEVQTVSDQGKKAGKLEATVGKQGNILSLALHLPCWAHSLNRIDAVLFDF